MPLSKVLFAIITVQLLAFASLSRIQKAMDKQEYEKAKELIVKGYQKEPDNPGFSYYHALLLFTDDYDGFHADSARLLIAVADEKFQVYPEELRVKLEEEFITEDTIYKLGISVRNFLYKETLADLSLKSVLDFRAKYPKSPYENALIFKRDSMVFMKVRAENSIPGYQNFIAEFSISSFRPEADSLLDELRYQDLAEDGNLRDYLKFQQSYPTSFRTKEVEEYILKISTASHSAESLINFIRLAKTEVWKKRAADVLYYLEDRKLNDIHPKYDSLRAAETDLENALFPIMDRGLFGFQNEDGTDQLIPSYSQIQDLVKCGLLEDDWIFVKEKDQGKIILKNGEEIIASAEDYRSVSESIGLVKKSDNWILFHKSGFMIVELPIEEAEVFKNGWIKAKHNGKWGLFTLLGNPIAEPIYEDIYQIENFWIFEKDNLLAVYKKEEILKEVEDRGLSLEFKFDDLELVDDDKLIGFKGDNECLLDDQLDFLIPWGKYEIHPDPAGWYLRSKDGYYLYNNTDERIMDRKYKDLESNDGWLSLQTEEDWILIPRTGQSLPERNFDSIKLINRHAALVFKEEEKTLAFTNGNKILLDEHLVKSFPNSPDYLMISKDGALGVYNQFGESILDGKFEEISFINDTLLSITKNDKQGILKSDGSYLLNPIFSTISIKDNLISTLYKGGIGCYDLSNSLLIPPDYDARISKINDHYLVKKEGNYGLIDANEEEIISLSYEDIKYWNDTSFLVTQEKEQFLISISEEVLSDPISKLALLFEDQNESIYKFIQKGAFGLMSNQNGVILKPQYSEIVNIGDEEQPLFFADQHLSEAGFHVVSYVNISGELVFSKAYRKEEFDKILCED